ncbi:hypothetical protein BLNAU_5112 [Blattamonas nauphoetae]|uniref:Uncharacterized protein n=1 Tax=Blattamonas nauphoetae TaxID=2049346 RepID=A0ABQ9Y891_9EUKA|nr:hypothetical protein BLNAU_5112 [Blattamonas nauphoetae]
MKMLVNLFEWCSNTDRLTLFKADLIPQLVTTLNPQSLSFGEAVNIHTNLLKIIANSVRLATDAGLHYLGIEDHTDRQAVLETILQKVLVPSEQYIRHLCVNRHSMIDDDLSDEFMTLLARILRICPYYPPTMEIVGNMPIVLTIPSCLAFFETKRSICNFLFVIIDSQREWNRASRYVQDRGKQVPRMLRMEGFEDVIEEQLQNNKAAIFGEVIVLQWIQLSNLLVIPASVHDFICGHSRTAPFWKTEMLLRPHQPTLRRSPTRSEIKKETLTLHAPQPLPPRSPTRPKMCKWRLLDNQTHPPSSTELASEARRNKGGWILQDSSQSISTCRISAEDLARSGKESGISCLLSELKAEREKSQASSPNLSTTVTNFGMLIGLDGASVGLDN